MVRRRVFEPDDLRQRFPGDVAPRAALVALGMSHSAISRRCRANGPWRRLIPGVVMLTNGTPTRHQLDRAALVHAGAGAMITGVEAARIHGIRRLPSESRVHVLIPHERRVATRDFAVVERTIHLPEAIMINGLPVAPLARALIDAAHRMDKLSDVRAMITDAVQRQLCHPRELRHELEQGTTIGSALPRVVIEEMDRGVREAARAWASQVGEQSKLPEPQWNVEIRDGSGALLGVTDAYWPDIGLAWAVDAPDFRLDPTGYGRAARERTRLAAAGVVVVHTPPVQLRKNPAAVVADLRAGYVRAVNRPPPDVRTRLSRAAA
ncbi:hypothetical protein DI005_34935 [Prauserella sp. PE36]|uniref:hypothetical protein n=1 Tax=Prauserella sp. PE36 TaxID=1504709 RepID=UPI000DE2A155|nr:hypothetical protein [Prauserella sp. PE36]RBM10886.1 hypothetical protein DI005_34935 [Prauserella sp. PE36]